MVKLFTMLSAKYPLVPPLEKGERGGYVCFLLFLGSFFTTYFY